jgi:hypothetical protein
MILDGLRAKGNALAELILGTIMVGVLPLENVVEWGRARGFLMKSPDIKQSLDYKQDRALLSHANEEAPSSPDGGAPLSD